jgi:hypothetical protein
VNSCSNCREIAPRESVFRVELAFLIKMSGRQLIGYFGSSMAMAIPKLIEIMCANCFYSCKSLQESTFESNSQSRRIDESASRHFTRIDVPTSVQIFVQNAFVHANHFKKSHSNPIYNCVELRNLHLHHQI